MKDYGRVSVKYQQTQGRNDADKYAYKPGLAQARCTLLGLWQGRTTDVSVKTNKRKRK